MEKSRVLGYKVCYLMGASTSYLKSMFPEVYALDKSTGFFGTRRNCRKYRCISASFFVALQEAHTDDALLTADSIKDKVLCRIDEDAAFYLDALQGIRPGVLTFLSVLAALATDSYSDVIREAELVLPGTLLAPLLTLPWVTSRELPLLQCVMQNTEVYFGAHAIFNVGMERMLSDDAELARRVYLYGGVPVETEVPADISAIAITYNPDSVEQTAESPGKAEVKAEAVSEPIEEEAEEAEQDGNASLIMSDEMLVNYTHYFISEAAYTKSTKKIFTRVKASTSSIKFMGDDMACVKAALSCAAANRKPLIVSTLSGDLLAAVPENSGVDVAIIGEPGGEVEQTLASAGLQGVYLLPKGT